MRKNVLCSLLAVLSILNIINAQVTQNDKPVNAGETMPVEKYINANNDWDADSLGNIRAVLKVTDTGKTVLAYIYWRRRDTNPAEKRVIVEDAQTHKRVMNAVVTECTNVSGIILFEATSGPGTYYVYYMPYKNEGRSNYPRGVYLKPDTTATPGWLGPVNKPNRFAGAVCTAIQSINAFNSPYPMEVVASGDEVNSLVSRYAADPFLVFPEYRQYSIRMKKHLPFRWIEKGPFTSFSGIADKGEFYTFQLGVYALQDLKNLSVRFSDFKGAGNTSIAGNAITCINTNGVSYDGRPFTKKVDVEKGNVQALWCSLRVPVAIPAGVYKGTATIYTNGQHPKNISISITVNNHVAVNGNIGEPEKMTRLHWLNSTLAQDNTVIKPYTPLEVNGKTISMLGRKLELNNDGFPKQIQTFFTEEMTGYSPQPNNELAAPLHFDVITADGEKAQWTNNGVSFIKKEPGTVVWTAVNKTSNLQMNVSASMEFDGFIAYTVKIAALADVALQDISMQIPFNSSAATYMMGLGHKGDVMPDTILWKWDVAHKNQDGAWIGAVNAGLQYSLRDENYVRPLNTNFYLQKPLLLPTSWGNNNNGGINISRNGGNVVANNYSGQRTMKKGDVLYYNFNLLITPFHPINTDFQWETRFYHKYNNLDTIKATGATVVNIHHATPINPWINYPFIEWRKMKAYIDSAHNLGLKVKIYNTIRELSDHAYETFALRSLGHEVYSPGKGGGFSWLQEHIDSDYIAAWFVPEIKDAAIVNSGMNRWHNYYVEGMNWLVNNVGIDGIYLDDVAFDRVTMKRIKRVLTQNGHPGIIDLHSANQYDKSDGFNNSAMLYMEHFPYLSRLWFGEYFDYENNDPGFFLTEVSGIPFGLMGEMLQGDGNLWRGMIYGMTNRLGWSAKSDPRPIWKLWNEIGMHGIEMIGYWSSHCPVKTSNDKVLATVYKKKDLALISIASWADTDVNVQLNIDWKALGIEENKATIIAPAIENFQPGKTFIKDEKIPVKKNEGWLIVVKE
ncbi:MAG TPA: glycoside hydrolase domain-containing protein [Chitinophagaceae bacterium]|nr:glycoside hydrolase domain-containing protein [Chitinophagaceae bacterium]